MNLKDLEKWVSRGYEISKLESEEPEGLDPGIRDYLLKLGQESFKQTCRNSTLLGDRKKLFERCQDLEATLVKVKILAEDTSLRPKTALNFIRTALEDCE